MTKKDLTFEEQKDILTDFLQEPGTSKEASKNVAKKHDVSANTVNAIVSNNPYTQTEIERKNIAFRVLAENKTIAEIKDKALEEFRSVIEELANKKDKHQFVGTLNTIINTVDKIYRLNFELPTEILNTKSQNTNTNINISEIVKELKTPEEKRNFLLSQMENARNPKNNNGTSD